MKAKCKPKHFHIFAKIHLLQETREKITIFASNQPVKMVVEDKDTSNSTITDDQISTGASSNPNNPKVVRDSDEDELEEGEIVGEDDSAATSKASSSAVLRQPHPLENSWTFWFDNPSAKSRQAAWGSSIRRIYSFSTVEEFWSVYNNIHHPSKLAVGADFYCFKAKIEPKWEDPICANGGKWTITIPRGKSDIRWLYTLLAMIGEQFDQGDEICGAVVNVRKREDRVSIWTKNATNEAAQLSIGKQWKELLDYNETIGFIFHEDAKHLDRNAKNKYTV